MIRVDHAGEFGAMRIYEGQLAVLEARGRDVKAVAAIRRMAEQESRHLERFNTLPADWQARMGWQPDTVRGQ